MNAIKKSMLAAGLLAFSTAAASALPAVVSTDLNLRSGPGTVHQVIAVMQAGASVDTLGCGAGWCRIAYGGQVGYASQNYLDFGQQAVRPGFRAYGQAARHGSRAYTAYERPRVRARTYYRHPGYRDYPPDLHGVALHQAVGVLAATPFCVSASSTRCECTRPPSRSRFLRMFSG
jgi:uncharacterized protein YraI